MSAFPTIPTFTDRAQSQSATADADELQNWHGEPNPNEIRHTAHSVHMNKASGGKPESNRCHGCPYQNPSLFRHYNTGSIIPKVRLMVGTLKAVGCGVLNIDDVRNILAAKSINATPAINGGSLWALPC